MDGRIPESRTSKVIRHSNKVLITDTEKSNAFIKQYANVRKLLKEQQDRHVKHELHDQCGNECNSCKGEMNGICNKFNLPELDEVIRQLPLRKAHGKDGISNVMIKKCTETGQDYFC